MKNDNFWFCCWMVIFSILYCGAIAWPIVMIFIWEMEKKIKKLFKVKE